MAWSSEHILNISAHMAQWLLMALLITGLLLTMERLYFLHRTRTKPELLLVGIHNLLAEKRFGEALVLCEQTPGALARVVKRLLMVRDFQDEQKEREYLLQAQWEVEALERRLGSIALIGKMLPLVGFLGTAAALFSAFSLGEKVAIYSSADLFSGAITQSFLLTICGICGGILMNLSHHFLYGRVRSCCREIQSAARQIFCELSHNH